MKTILTSIFTLQMLFSMALAQEVETYQNNLDMRTSKKIGVGASVGGPLGVAGGFIELNLDKENSVTTGIGGGPGYNSFIASWKRTFEGTYVNPYINFGYSHWSGSAAYGSGSQSAILNQILTASEINEGKFGVNFMTASGGLQYNHLEGLMTGLSFFFQFDAMNTLKNDRLVLNGALGSIYYF